MLSYRHAFHAGGPADVLKHAVYAFVLRYMTAKARPFYVLDTHAGAAWYDLRSDAARKTGEAERGLLRLWGAAPPWPELLAPYRDVLEEAEKEGVYPGSPLIARHFLRSKDRLELVELHPTDHAALASAMDGMARVRVVREDGLALLVSRMPPPERRAVVLVDPSYEVKTDYELVVAALARAHRRFANGMYLLWYPVIERERATALLEAMRASGIRAQYRVELGLAPDAPGRGMTGSGLVIVNPPWTLPAAVAEGLPWLAGQLGAEGATVAEWLVPE